MAKFTKLVRSAFVRHYKDKDINAIKSFDNITKDSSVSPRSGNNTNSMY
jgi:hypothetical protein